jgi:N-acetylmuramoyl-L-alanine amidase
MKLQFLIIHCTATPEHREVTSDEIRYWHLSPPPIGRGWHRVGYSDMIHLDGTIENLIPYNEDDNVDPWELTNGVSGENSISRHIVYVGGMTQDNKKELDTRNKEQLITMALYVRNMIKNHPAIKIAGHNQFAQKACPSFNVPEWLKSIGIDEKNIYKA